MIVRVNGQITVNVTVLVSVAPPSAVIVYVTVNVPIVVVGSVILRQFILVSATEQPDYVIPVPEAENEIIGQSVF